MKTTPTKYLRSSLALCAGFTAAALLTAGSAQQANAAVGFWTPVGSGAYEDGANWSTPAAPGAADIGVIENGGTAVISTDFDVQALTVGLTSPTGTGNYVMNSGFVRINEDLTGTQETVIGFLSGSSGTFIMNGGTIHNNDPDGAPGLGSLPGNDLSISKNANTTATFELHNDAVYRSSDDVDLGDDNSNQGTNDYDPLTTGGSSNGTIIMTGNSEWTQGDGIGVKGRGTINLSDNAVMTLGNSMGVANPNGRWSENGGWLNFGQRAGSTFDMLIENNAQFNIRRINSNEGVQRIVIKDQGEFNIFNTAEGGTQTAAGSQNYLARQGNSTRGWSDVTYTLEGSGKFTVDSATDAPNAQHGLILSGGDDNPVIEGGNGWSNDGGAVLIDVKDSAEFSIVQSLWMAYGDREGSSAIVKITGPDANVSFGEDLYMARSIEGTTRPGTARLHSVITGSDHTTIMVGDDAFIANGELLVELDGYNPIAGDSYTILSTGAAGVMGEFETVDLSLAPLDAGLLWLVDYNDSSVVLSVAIPEPTSALLALVASAGLVATKRNSRV